MWLAVLEHVDDAVVADEAGVGERWQPRHIGRAVDGLAALHAIWFDREDTLRALPWIGHVQSASGAAEMSSLWSALAHHAAPLFSSWADAEITTIHRHLVSSVDRWWTALEAGPRTLIHNDFNPRNICLRGEAATLCAYDWELAAIGAPQRDLAELLCFVLPQDASRDEVTSWVERHRVCLEREVGVRIDSNAWHEGFRSGLYDFLINRLAIYAMVHRVRRQPFLPRIVASWRNLYRLFPLERAS
jgi:aminoglycoside phosphotransferase (APT) family kinase protein